MSGHSKWSTIKRKKGVADQKRGKIFTRIIHEITVAVKEGGGGDVNGNARLRLAVDKAKSVNMPGTNIERAIKRATGEIKGEAEEEITYEGYGPGRTAILVHVITNNRNRTVGEIRHAFSRAGGAMGETNSVAFMFERKGVITLKKETISEEALMETALDAGADDISDDNDVWVVTCEPRELHAVRTALGTKKIAYEEAEITYVPKTTTAVDPKDAEKLVKLLETLEELEDVLSVSANCDFVE